MSFEMLSVAQISGWLYSLYGGVSGPREGITVNAVANYTGIPVNSLRWLSKDPKHNISLDRQRLLSKVIAQVENGQLVFEGVGSGKRAVIVTEAPKPRVRYGVAIAGGAARLTFVDRPKAVRTLPAFKDLALGRKPS